MGDLKLRTYIPYEARSTRTTDKLELGVIHATHAFLNVHSASEDVDRFSKPNSCLLAGGGIQKLSIRSIILLLTTNILLPIRRLPLG